jgi:hypothetical protein
MIPGFIMVQDIQTQYKNYFYRQGKSETNANN